MNRSTYEFNDSHFHLTNYIQEGTDIREFVEVMMGKTIGRSTLFGIPLQQQWSYANTGDFAPKYYLQTDAPLYYYSFTDAWIAMAYKSLSLEQQSRLDPMISGFHPADMYAADHIRRVLQTFPGVFSGIGEFTIHKEFVSSKIPGETASLTNPALDRILDFAGEVGLVVIIHNDIDAPFPSPDQEPFALQQIKELFRRHPNTKIIWAHVGVGRVVRPVREQAVLIERALNNVPRVIARRSRTIFGLSVVELTFAGSTTPVVRHRRDLLTGSIIDRAVQQACAEAVEGERLGAERPGLSLEMLMKSFDRQFRAVADQINEYSARHHLELPDGVRVATVRRVPQPSILPIELQRNEHQPH